MKQRKAMNTAEAGSDESIGDELVRELKHLRTVIREVGENFILRKEGDIEAIIASLASVPASRLRTEGSHWLRGLRNQESKPSKGRLRDLRELHELIGRLADDVLSAQTTKKRRPRTTE